MPVALPEPEIAQPEAEPRLLVELPSRTGTFFRNLRDLAFTRELPPLELESVPAEFWPDVFVQRRLPWSGFVESGACHALAFALLVIVSRFLALQPHVIPQPMFDRSQVVYYQPSEYLPPIDTRSARTEAPRKADPELAKQPIISLPREADNRSQTIVTPPNVKLKRDVAMPNIVAWSDQQKPQLEIPPVPMTPAAEIARLTPNLDNSVVAPPQDVNRAHQRNAMNLQAAVVAPPSEVQSSRTAPKFDAPQPSVIAPPPTMDTASTRNLGQLNVGHTAVINPAPQLAVGEQRAVPGGRSSSLSAVAPQVVAPPPSLASGGSGATGARGRVIALNLHPALGAPPDASAGNRRGAFAAGPSGHAGASGAPGGATGSATGDAGSAAKKSDLPSGLYVGDASPKTSAVAGDPGPAKSANPNVVASVNPARVTNSTKPMQPGNPAKLSEAERSVFGDRKFYSLTLNMPNLNSAGGSWVIKFAEMNHEWGPHTDDKPAPADLSQPMATKKVDPAYPLQLMRENVSGTVILYAVIHSDGSVGNVRILRGVDDRLDRFAMDAISQWKFEPATKNGAAVDVEATFQIPFKPSRVGTNF